MKIRMIIRMIITITLIISLIVGIFLIINNQKEGNMEFKLINEIPQPLWINGSGNICSWQGEYFVCEEIDTGRIFRADKNLNEIDATIKIESAVPTGREK